MPQPTNCLLVIVLQASTARWKDARLLPKEGRTDARPMVEMSFIGTCICILAQWRRVGECQVLLTII